MEVTHDQATGTPVEIRMRKPADMHQHFRDGAMLQAVAPLVAQRFAMAIVMPNLVPPLTTCSTVLRYAGDIIDIAQKHSKNFRALMTMYLTDTLDPREVARGLDGGPVTGIKYYPPGLTTNSDSGVRNPESLWIKGTKPYECLRALADNGGVFLIHAADGKTSAPWRREGRRDYQASEELDPFDQEPHFICESLPRIIDAHHELKISVEHLSTAVGAQFIRSHGNEKLGCSLTAHHLLLDRRDLFRRGFNPHRSWMPIIQPKEHKEELRKLAKEGHSFVWLGSDSAPHPKTKKEADCCVSGVLMAHAGIEFYVEAFEDMGTLDERFEQFASVNGPRFYGLLPSDEKITLVREEWEVQPLFLADGYNGNTKVVPFRLGEQVRWKLAT